MAKKKISEKKMDIQERELTEEEQQRLERFRQRNRNKPNKIKLTKGGPKGSLYVEAVNHDDPLFATKFMEMLGTSDPDLQQHLLNQVALSFAGVATAKDTDKEKSIQACNTAMAILNGIQPQDELEAMLSIQMIGVHNMAMQAIARAMLRGQTFEGKEANVNQATKMLRTFAVQMEALKNYRTGGQQKMTVEHVHVNNGGQAIVGTVNQGGVKKNENCG